MYLINYEYVIS